ncbi:MAG: family 10 glycosylhydrolase [Gammaproteobacteria bacterium]
MARRGGGGIPVAVAALLLAVAAGAVPGAAAAPAERRVIFDESMHWAYSEQATDAVLARIEAAGFNVYVPCVWHGKGTYYPSPLVTEDATIQARIARGEDPLRYLVERAHERGIEVHPWFTVVRREDDRLPEFYGPRTPADAFDVHNPGFRRFITDLMVDMVERYPVDGINLDYIRSMGFCRDQRCAADYNAKYGRSLELDIALAKLGGTAFKTLAQWNGAAVGDIVRTVAAQVRKKRPEVVISVDAHPLLDDLRLQGQDSIQWANNGWVDVVFNMDYRRKVDVRAASRARELLHDPRKMTMLLATYDRVGDSFIARESGAIEEYVRLARERWPGGGIAFYHYVRLSDEQIEALGRGVFAQRARAR